MNLECPKCGYKWNFNGKANRVQCPQCKKFFRLNYKPARNPANKTKPAKQTCQISDDIMQGNILDALEKADINPTNHHEMFKDAIPLILKDDELKFAFAQACQDRKRSPEVIVRKAVRVWLKENRYI